MLQQIIKEMYIEPDLLAELSDEQKQMIFLKIREEQVRRWKEREDKLDKQEARINLKPKLPPKPGRKAVSFMMGADQNPWVWVMGEHESDRTIEQILEEEALEKAKQKAEKEAEELRIKEEKEAELREQEEAKRLLAEKKRNEELAAAAAAAKKKADEDLKERQRQEAISAQSELEKLKLSPKPKSTPMLCKRHSSDLLINVNVVPNTEYQNNNGNKTASTSPAITTATITTASKDKPRTFEFGGEIYELTSPREPCEVNSCRFCFKEKSEKARLTREVSYRELKEKRANEILSAFHKTRALWETKAAEESQKLDQEWQLQESKAKQADSDRRKLAKYAREDYKRNNALTQSLKPGLKTREAFRESAVLLGNAITAVKPGISSKRYTNRPPRPSSKREVEQWFVEEEKDRKVGLDTDGAVERWFHGAISREEAEKLLENKPNHSFIVRVSEKIWGYAISYKAEDRCKHYLVDISDNGYQFFGTNQLEHQSLSQLIHYHKNHPVSTAGQELLLHPVGQTKTPPDYATLFPELLESTSL